MKYKITTLLLACLINTYAVNAQLGRTNFDHSYPIDFFPEIEGGKDEMKRFLHDHLIYPAEDLKNKKEGSVVIYFVVTKEGKATNAKITTSATPGMNKEALRLFKLINNWMPAYKDDKSLDSDHSLEVTFSLSKYKKTVKERGFDTPLYIDIPTDTSLNVYETAERSPLYSNPEKTFTEFIYTNMQYPETATRQGIEGNVKLTFVVEPDGKVSNINILKGVNGGCNEEAIRVIGLTKWQPAIRDKQYVRYRMSFTMNFSLKNNFKDNSNGNQRSWGQ